ncbi:MAG: hypothetical protein ABIQ73_10655 [Acidimicrobiales bacterium]
MRTAMGLLAAACKELAIELRDRFPGDTKVAYSVVLDSSEHDEPYFDLKVMSPPPAPPPKARVVLTREVERDPVTGRIERLVDIATPVV